MIKHLIDQYVNDVTEQVIAWRRYLHQHPELSFQEVHTSQYVYDTLSTFGNLELSRPTKTSVVARLTGKELGKVLAIRADIDALPIKEENTFDFASQNPGVMHACGHDGHTAIVLGTAKVLSRLKEHIKGEIRFIFQHAEESPPGGAQEMVKAGVMDGVDMVIGTHLLPNLEVGKIALRYGTVTAAPDEFHIVIQGKGGHGAFPQLSTDSIAIGAQVVTNLQHIVARNVDPMDNVVISVTRFIGGEAYNVIPDTVEIGGTVRTFDPKVRENVITWMERVVKGITEAHGASYQFEYRRGYDSVINDQTITKQVEESLRETFGDQAVVIMDKPAPGGEDFSAFLHKAPGTFIGLGAGNREKGITYPHHHPRFTIDEDSLPIGVKMFANLAFKLLDIEKNQG